MVSSTNVKRVRGLQMSVDFAKEKSSLLNHRDFANGLLIPEGNPFRVQDNSLLLLSEERKAVEIPYPSNKK